MTVVRELITKLGFDADLGDLVKADLLLTNLHKGLEFVTTAVVDFAKEVARTPFEIAKTSKELQVLQAQTGDTANSLQRLQYAAQRSETSPEALAQGLGNLSRVMAEASKGSGEAADAFARIGVRTKQANGTLRPTNEVLNDVADVFARLPAGADRTALSMQLFGRSGKELIPFLANGSSGIRALGDEAERLGLVLSDSALGAGAELSESLEDIDAAMRGVKLTIGQELLPSFKEFFGELAAWLKEYGPSVARVFGGTLGFISKVILQLLKLIGSLASFGVAIAKALGAAWTYFAERFGYVKTILVTALAVIGGAVAAFGSTAILAALGVVKAWLLAAAPFLATAAAVLLLALAIEDLWVFINGGESVIGDALQWLREFREEFIKPNEDDPWWMTALRALVWFLGDLKNTVPEVLNNIGTDIRNFFVDLFANVGKLFKMLTPDLSSVFSFGGGVTASAQPSLVPASASVPPLLSGTPAGTQTSKSMMNAPMTFNITQQPGQSGKDLAQMIGPEVRRQLDLQNQEAQAGGT